MSELVACCSPLLWSLWDAAGFVLGRCALTMQSCCFAPAPRRTFRAQASSYALGKRREDGQGLENGSNIESKACMLTQRVASRGVASSSGGGGHGVAQS